MRYQRAMLAGLVMLSLFMAQGLADSQGLSDPKTATTPKVGAVLSALHEEYTSRESQADGTDFESENPLVRIVEDRVVIDAIASGATGVLRADLEALELQKAASFGHMVSGQLPIRAIADADALDSFQFARPAGATGRDPGGPGTARPRENAD